MLQRVRAVLSAYQVDVLFPLLLFYFILFALLSPVYVPGDVC